VAVLGLLATAAGVFLFIWMVEHTSYDTWGAFLVAPVLVALTIALAKHAASLEADPRLTKLILWALALKLLAALARYYVAFDLYDGVADAGVYIGEGKAYAEGLRQGIVTYAPERGGSSGTFFVRQLTGWVFFFIGPTAVGGFFVFAWMGFLGQYFFYRAFRTAVPDGDHRRYAVLVFFLPSVLYWPASIGKEAWMLLTLGLGAYGAARILAHQRGGYLLLGLGMAGSAAVRPHMTVLLAAGLTVAYLLRRTSERSMLGPVTKIVGGVLVLAAMFFAVQAAEERFGVEGEGLSGAEEVIDRTAEQTAKGGSEFEAQRPDSLLDVPAAIFTVMYRPLPFEAHNAQALLTSMEGVLLIGLTIASRRRLRGAVRESLRTPYVALASVYSLLFMLAFSSFGNFGILARQRAQLFPLVLVLFALPAVQAAHGRRRQHGPVLEVVAPRHTTLDRTADRQGRRRRPIELVVDLPPGALERPDDTN
jgi:hypothetical protein